MIRNNADNSFDAFLLMYIWKEVVKMIRRKEWKKRKKKTQKKQKKTMY